MSSSPDDAPRAVETPPLTVVAGWDSVLPVPQDPIGAWLDLMEVVEALCPQWPAQAATRAREFRL